MAVKTAPATKKALKATSARRKAANAQTLTSTRRTRQTAAQTATATVKRGPGRPRLSVEDKRAMKRVDTAIEKIKSQAVVVKRRGAGAYQGREPQPIVSVERDDLHPKSVLVGVGAGIGLCIIFFVLGFATKG